MILTISGCDKERALVLFSNNPIERETFSVDKCAVTFTEGRRIYFVLYNPKPFTSDVLRIQVLKIDRIAPLGSVSIVYGQDVEIDKTRDYFTDYFCLHKEGYYLFRIFSSDKMDKPIAEADFQVNSL